METKPKLLLHVCCAPCAIYIAPELQKEYQVSLFFYNPNINIPQEYEKRREEVEKTFASLGIPVIIGEYNSLEWEESVRGWENQPEGGKRCQVCFNMRLTETARVAGERGFDLFATVLTVTPRKNARLINSIGEKISQRTKIPYLVSDFKKKDGFKKSVEISRQLNLYRQNYCGCTFSINDIKIKQNS